MTTSITVYELFAGAFASPLEQDIRNLLFGLEILPLDAESAEIAAVELLRQPGVCTVGVELPRCEPAHRAGCAA